MGHSRARARMHINAASVTYHVTVNNNKSDLLVKSSRLEISELRNYFTKI